MSAQTREILLANRTLAAARAHGDKLQIELAQDALNDLLDRYAVTLETGNEGKSANPR